MEDHNPDSSPEKEFGDKNTPDLLAAAEQHVFGIFHSQHNSRNLYHNFNHTQEVVKACKKIGKGVGLSQEDLEHAMLAGYFHDVGFLESPENHEARSADCAEKFLTEQGYPTEKITAVRNAILATRMPQRPETELEKVVCDADLAALGTERYFENSDLLRKEAEWFTKKKIAREEWLSNEVEFLSNHHYHTPYAQLRFGDGKARNILAREKELADDKSRADKLEAKAKKEKEAVRKKTAKDAKPERGIETMFRTTLRNHINLSAIADNKANIMLSINAIIISIAASGLLPNFDENPFLILPTGVLALTCLLAIVFAILATRPSVTKGTFSKTDISNKQSNLLFFGNFFKMKLDDFEWGMWEMMKDKDFLYGTMIRDFYYLGVVLAKKYKYLRWCYIIFSVGMIVSVLAFAWQFYQFTLTEDYGY